MRRGRADSGFPRPERRRSRTDRVRCRPDPDLAACQRNPTPFTTSSSPSIGITAPHGLEDLFAMRVRRNPAVVSVATYRQRVAEKRYAERWPRVTVVPC